MFDYVSAIIKMVHNIKDEETLIKIYTVVKTLIS